MASSASRMLLRQPRITLQRAAFRNASTTSEAANAAKEKASQASSKASEGLSRVTSSASSAITKVGSAAGNAVGKIGGRTGRLIGRVSALIPPTIYYSKVGLELGKIIFEHRKMSPPSLQTFQSYFQTVVKNLKNPSNALRSSGAAQKAAQEVAQNPQALLSQARNISSAQLAAAGVVAAELLGFFSVGEIIGRFKIVGYRGGSHAEHH